MTIEEDIFAAARSLGFAAAGIADAAPSAAFENFNKWLNSGNSADMDFLKKSAHLRADIRNVMPEAKSVISVAARYPVNLSPGKGFSSYCRGMDYHIVIRKKLEQLAAFINKTQDPPIRARICVDSAPLIEREWAIRSGLGWRGRQGQIVNHEHGCCLVIGELLIDRHLQPTEPAPNRCGECRICIEACPTGALSEDGQIDCRKCLSYITIEHKGEIPTSLHEPLGQTLFGCDMCTAVCPWNKTEPEVIMPELRERPMPDAGTIMTMTESQFTAMFKDTAVYRTGLERLKRNAAIALKNHQPQ